MALTNFPNGITSFGVPVIGGGAQIPVTTGKYVFVSSGSGSNGNDGASPDSPKATVAGALLACRAGKGDVIVCMPGHAETVTATSLNLNVAGVQVVCLGSGSAKPTFTYGAAAATITVSAANCAFRGAKMVANFLNVAAAFTVGAAVDFDCAENMFVDTSSILNFLSMVVTGSTDNAADGLSFRNNYVLGLATTDGAVVSILGNLNRLLVSGNFADKAATNNAGHMITLSSKVILGARIIGNQLVVVGATTATVGIFLTGSSTTNTGLLAYNLVSSLDTTSELIATAGTNLKFFENYYTGTADASGKLWPAVDAA